MSTPDETAGTAGLGALLVDSTERLLGEHCTRAALESAEGGTWPAAMWDALESTGLTIAARSEARGGVGANWNDLAQLSRLAGAHALPAPLVETHLAEQMLCGAGLDAIDGPLGIGPVLESDKLTLVPDGDGFVVSGQLRRIPWGRDVAAIVALAYDQSGAVRTIVIRNAVPVTLETNYAFEPRDSFSFDRHRVAAADAGAPGKGFGSEDLRLRGALLRSLQIAGALERILAQTVQYAKDRTQFGKPIGKFQAIQHQIASMASQVASASTAALSAAAMGSSLEIAMAKTRASEAAGLAAGVAHQVLGAIGFTHEHMLNFSTRRLWSWRDEFGSDTQWAGWIGQQLAAQTDGEALWSLLTAADARVGAA